MKNKIKYLSIFIALFALAFSSCKEREPDMFSDVKGTYFSINQYVMDEWGEHKTDPVVFSKKITVNGKTTDSSYVNLYNMDWNYIFKIFLATDISDRKFLGRYKFSQFDDASDNTHDFMYIASNKDMYTQQFLITMDIATNRVTGIYAETHESNFWKTTDQKLYYAPMKTIQIQQFETPMIGKKKTTKIQYDVK